MHHIKFLDKNGDQSLGPVHSTDEASKNWDYGGLHDSNYSSSVINFAADTMQLPLKI